MGEEMSSRIGEVVRENCSGIAGTPLDPSKPGSTRPAVQLRGPRRKDNSGSRRMSSGGDTV